MLMIAVALVPMLESLQPGLRGSEILNQQNRVHFALRGQLETVLAEPFASLDAAASAAGDPTSATAYSDLAAPVLRAALAEPQANDLMRASFKADLASTLSEMADFAGADALFRELTDTPGDAGLDQAVDVDNAGSNKDVIGGDR